MPDLSHLKVGDQVAIPQNIVGWGVYPNIDYAILTIERETNTLFILNNGKKIKKETGVKYGKSSSYSFIQAEPVTVEIIQKVIEQKAARELAIAADKVIDKIKEKRRYILNNTELAKALIEYGEKYLKSEQKK